MKEKTAANDHGVNRALTIYVVLVVTLTVLSWVIYHFYPTFDRRPLFTQDDRFRDLLNYWGKTLDVRHASAALGKGMPIFSYPPAAAILWHLLLHTFPDHPLAPYLVLAGIGVLIYAIVAIRACDKTSPSAVAAMDAVCVTAAVGYPLWYALDRANLEGLVWAISGATVWLFLRQRYSAAAVCLGIAVGIKPFPMIYVIVFLLRRRFKEAALAAVITGAMVLGGFLVIGPNPWKAYQDLKPGAALYTETYLQTLRSAEELRFAHSILDGMKSLWLIDTAHTLDPTTLNERVGPIRAVPAGSRALRILVAVYPAIAALILSALILLVRRAPTLNQVTVLALAATLLPPNASDYTLLNLYVPFAALVVFLTREVSTGRRSLERRTLVALAVIYALLFSPLSFLRIYSGDVRLVLLLALTVVMVRTPMPTTYFGDTAESPSEDLDKRVAA